MGRKLLQWQQHLVDNVCIASIWASNYNTHIWLCLIGNTGVKYYNSRIFIIIWYCIIQDYLVWMWNISLKLLYLSTWSLSGDAVLTACRRLRKWSLTRIGGSLGEQLRLFTPALLPIHSSIYYGCKETTFTLVYLPCISGRNRLDSFLNCEPV